MSNFYKKIKKKCKKFLKNYVTLKDLKEVWIFVLPHPRILKPEKDLQKRKKMFLKKHF
jgi:hypothetical protein